MSDAITVEVQFFLLSILWGALILLAYDTLRVIRRLIRHNAIAVAIQDILFWITAGVFIFAMIYRENNGIIRGFCVMGMSIGMVLYHYLFSGLLVKTITKIIQTLLKPLVMAMNVLKKGYRFLVRKIVRLINFIGRRLKNRMKSVKIAMGRKKQLAFEKHQKKAQQKAMERKKKKQLRTSAKKPEAAINNNVQRETEALERTADLKGIAARKPKVELRVIPDRRSANSAADKLRKVH